MNSKAVKLALLCWAFSGVCGLLSFVILLYVPAISILSEPDGSRYLFVNRQADLPTGDPASFADYSLMPFGCLLAACSAFCLFAGAFFWGGQANPASAVDGGIPVLPDAGRRWPAATDSHRWTTAL